MLGSLGDGSLELQVELLSERDGLLALELLLLRFLQRPPIFFFGLPNLQFFFWAIEKKKKKKIGERLRTGNTKQHTKQLTRYISVSLS